MDTRVQLQPAYVLHRQPFKNTSLLLDFFSLDYGRIKAVAKGARREKSKYRPLIQPFQPLLISFSGRSEVKTVVGVEASVSALQIKGPRLFSAMYINELLTRLLHTYVEHKNLYKLYQESLIALQGAGDLEPLLRQFELSLLNEIGYGINLAMECETNEAIVENEYYRFIVDVGFALIPKDSPDLSALNPIKGSHLIALRESNFTDVTTAQTAKRLLRTALARHLGDKPLTSRALFSQLS